MTSMPRNNYRARERGNAFFFILLGIVLFAALAFTLTRGMRGNTTTRLTSKQTDIALSEIMNYMQRVERAVDRVRQKGCSENDISLENGLVAGYEHSPPVPEKCRVFLPAGGGVSWTAAPVAPMQYDFWGGNAVSGIGTAKNDLVMVLRITDNVQLCTVFNSKNGLNSIPGGSQDEDTTLFTGDFDADNASLSEAPKKNAACINPGGAGDYIIYNVLLAR